MKGFPLNLKRIQKYFKFLWVVFVLLVYLPVMIIGALIVCHKGK